MVNWRGRRPAPAYLTSFYLMVSVGGAIGGLLIGFAAPYLLNGLYDLPIVVSLTAFLLVYLSLARARKVRKATAPFLDAPYDTHRHRDADNRHGASSWQCAVTIVKSPRS